MKTRGITSAAFSLLAIVALGFLGAWIYIAYQGAGFKSEISTIEAEARNRSAESSYLISVRTALRESKDELEEIDRRFISKDDVPEYINMIETKAAEAGVKAELGTISVDARSLIAKISGNGTWRNVVAFVSNLDSMPYASKIESLGLDMVEGAESAVSWNFNMSITQFLTTEKK